MRTTLLAMITTIALMSPAYALNRCVDAAGKVNYTDLPCEANQKSGAVNLSGVGKSDVPQVEPDSSKFSTSNRTAAIQAYLAKTEASRASGKTGPGLNGADKDQVPGQSPAQALGQASGAGNLTSEMEKEIARLSKQLKAAREQAANPSSGK